MIGHRHSINSAICQCDKRSQLEKVDFPGCMALNAHFVGSHSITDIVKEDEDVASEILAGVNGLERGEFFLLNRYQ